MAYETGRRCAACRLVQCSKTFALTATFQAGQANDLSRAQTGRLRRPGHADLSQYRCLRADSCPMELFELTAALAGHGCTHLPQADRVLHGVGCQNAAAQDQDSRSDCRYFLELMADENDYYAVGRALPDEV